MVFENDKEMSDFMGKPESTKPAPIQSAEELPKEIMERLAKIEHDRWGGQAKTALYDMTDERRERWERLAHIEYSDLDEHNKELDRMQVREYLPIIMEWIESRDAAQRQAGREERCDNCNRESAINAFRMDELDAVMLSVDKWLDGPALRNNPATRAADARETALKEIEKERERADKLDKRYAALVLAAIVKVEPCGAVYKCPVCETCSNGAICKALHELDEMKGRES